MAAFRFLALLTVGFGLLSLIFLLHAHQGRLEREMTREITGPVISLREGEVARWEVDFGGLRIEEAWPGEQRQPHFFLRGLGDAEAVVEARYLEPAAADGEPRVAALAQAFIGADAGGGPRTPVPEEERRDKDAPEDTAYGPLWLSWEHPLEVTVRVTAVPENGAHEATPVLRGYYTINFFAARRISRTLWAVFTVITAAGFAGLMLIMSAEGRGGGRASPNASQPSSGAAP